MIPEPSEDDFSYVAGYLKNPSWELKYNGEYLRVIAHLIRNGAEMAEAMQSISRSHVVVWDAKKKAAIALFEKLKEVCGE